MLTGISINKSKLEINGEARQIKRLKLVSQSRFKYGAYFGRNTGPACQIAAFVFSPMYTSTVYKNVKEKTFFFLVLSVKY